jgi:hypothetical protein
MPTGKQVTEEVKKPVFNIEKFWDFCSELRIDTKELGPIRLTQDHITGSQRYFVEQLADGLNNGIHTFVVLKGRQVMITTICLAIDLFWLGMYEGMSGSLSTQDEPTRDMIKEMLEMYLDGLPIKYKMPTKIHNRTQLVFKQNRSKFAYQVAGTRKSKSGFGRSKGLTFLHATEVAFWGDEDGIAALEASLAEMHPNRLFIWETTANGYNHFKDMWDDAKDAHTRKAIFIGWWRNDFYKVKRGSHLFEVYSDGRMTPTERKWVREIKQIYNYDIDDEQIAWWRWKMNEVIKDEQLMYQEFPPTEEYAFRMSGSQFFNSARLNDDMIRAKKFEYHAYRFVLRESFEQTELDMCSEKMQNLKIWQFPATGGHYVIGADPAYGSSEWADRFCASVWRCYADGMDQVAEFNTAECSPYQFAWVICYLAGAYKNTKLNLEINGPGQAVWTEMQNLKRNAAALPNGAGKGILDIVGNIQHFLYTRSDSLTGQPTAYHFKTTYDTKEWMLNFYKDCFERGSSVLTSPALLEEMKHVIRQDGALGAPGRGKDDRVIAAALAHHAWGDYTRMQLIRANVTRAVSRAQDANNNQLPINNVSKYMKEMGLTQT